MENRKDYCSANLLLKPKVASLSFKSIRTPGWYLKFSCSIFTESCPSPPKIRGAKLEERFARSELFPVGTVVKYDCVGQYKRVPQTKNSITCRQNYQWSPLEVFCKGNNAFSSFDELNW